MAQDEHHYEALDAIGKLVGRSGKVTATFNKGHAGTNAWITITQADGHRVGYPVVSDMRRPIGALRLTLVDAATNAPAATLIATPNDAGKWDITVKDAKGEVKDLPDQFATSFPLGSGRIESAEITPRHAERLTAYSR